MKILRIVYDWPPPWQGLAAHPYELTVSQAKKGHSIEVFCGRWPKAGNIETPNGVKIHPIMREAFPGAIFFTSSVILFFKYLSWRKKNKDVNIIHSHGHFAIWIYVYRSFLGKFLPWSKELKTPMVVHFHNIAKDRWNSMVKQNKQISLLSKYLIWPFSVFSDKEAVNSAAACVFVSVENKKKAVDLYGADERRCFVVETGVNPSLFKPVNQEEREKARKDIGFDNYDRIILNHGLMSERKNILLLIEAMKLLPKNYKLLLVGPGDSSYLGKLNQEIKISGLSDRVMQTGYTPYPQTPVGYQISDIFVLPSSWEGLPKVVMQGIACGTPCLVSGFKLSQEIKGLFYLESLKPEHIANYIIKILDNSIEVDSAKISLVYSWDTRAQELEKIYEFAQKNYLI